MPGQVITTSTGSKLTLLTGPPSAREVTMTSTFRAEKKARLHQKRSGLQSSTKLQSSQANSGYMRPELGRVLQ